MKPRERTSGVHLSWVGPDSKESLARAANWLELSCEILACAVIDITAPLRRLEAVTGCSIALKVRRPKNPVLAIETSFIKAIIATRSPMIRHPQPGHGTTTTTVIVNRL